MSDANWPGFSVHVAFKFVRWLKSINHCRVRTYQKRSPLRLCLEQLESRETPATFIWDGGTGADTLWSSGPNWVNDNAPTGNRDDLVFPNNVNAGLRNTLNDFSAGVFHSIVVSGSNYTLAGNSLTLGSATVPGSGSIIVNSGAANVLVSMPLEMAVAPGSRQFITVNFGADLTLSGNLTNVTSGVELTKQGTGTLILAGNNSGFSGPITIDNNSGILAIINPNALGDASNATRVGQNSQLQVRSGTGTVSEQLILNGSGIFDDGALLNVAGANTWAGAIELDSNASLGATAGSLNITGQISDLGSGHDLTKKGPGQIIFSRDNTYRGLTTINNGILTIRNPNALGTGTSSPQNGTFVNGLTAAATLQIDDPTGVGFTVQDELLTLNGPGFNNLGALSNFNGDNIWDGDITLGSSSSNGSDVSIGAELNSSGPTAGGPSTLDIQGVVKNNTAPGGPFNLTKVRPGNLIFSNANTYTGLTTIQEGDVQVDGTIGDVILSGASASLSGGGTVGHISGTAGMGGAVNPGANGSPAVPNTLSSNPGTNTVNFSAINSFLVDLNFADVSPGVPGFGHDVLVVNGNVNLGGAQLDGSVGFIQTGDVFTILQSTVAGVISGSFAEPVANNTAFIGGNRFTVTYNSNSVVLQRVKANVTLDVAASAYPSVYGQGFSYTATVTPAPGAGNISPSGTVTFLFNGSTVEMPLNASSQATFDPQTFASVTLPTGDYALDVTYNGDGNFNASSTPASLTHSVTQAGTQTVMTSSSPNPSLVSQAVSLTATVSALPSSNVDPTGGTVNFYDGAFPGGTLLGSASVGANNQATATNITFLSPGAHTITAVYQDNANYTGSTSTNAFSHFAEVGNRVLSYTQGPLVIDMAAAESYELVQAGTEAWFLRRDLGLFFPGSYSQNAFGTNEKWIQGTVQQPGFGNPWYIIRTNGQFVLWDRTPGRATGTVLANLDPIYWHNPALLWNPTAEHDAYILKQSLGLTFTGNLWQNFNGRQERWLVGTGGVWYYITPDGKFYLGSSGTFLATLDPIYYNQPARLYNAQPGQIVAAVTQPPNPNPSTLTITPMNQFVGRWIIELTTNNVRATSTKERFTVTVSNSLPVLPAILEQTISNPRPGPNTRQLTLTATDSDAGDTVNFVASAGHLGFVLQNLYSLRFADSYYTNSSGLGEKWVRGDTNQFNNAWYFIKPNGEFYAWSGAGAGGTLLATLDPIYHAYPDMLHSTTANDLAYATRLRLGLHLGASLFQDYGGPGTRWLMDSAGAWYFINSSGQVYKWDNTPNRATGTLLATFDPIYYTDIATRLAGAQPGQVSLQMNGNILSITPLATATSNFIGDIWVLIGATDDFNNPLNRRFVYHYFKVQVTG